MNHRERRLHITDKAEKPRRYDDEMGYFEKPSKQSRKDRLKKNREKHMQREKNLKRGQSGKNLHYKVNRTRHDFE